jgi:hypothetical protein
MFLKIVRRAHAIQRTLGTRSAAGYLRNQRVDIAEALFILTGQSKVRV